tara:strand:- start:991 stop:1824 length:834 start_codon:yes stop_codon:yes gene_type:complete
MSELCIYRGKVRDIYDIDEDFLLMRATNRVSSFNKHLGIVPGKGVMLNNMSKFWFEKTSHIINNHYVSSKGSNMIVKKCTPIKIEFVVRGYIAGNTSTSLWTHYSNGERLYCGIEFPDGLVKNQKLTTPVVTPTTKSDNDEPISKKDIIEQNILTSDECDFIYTKALQLFKYGQEIADKAGFILVDTKYEFGKTVDGEIILIDEIHTCDSSRYWLKNTYKERFTEKKEPDKLDKDCIRDWVRSKCDPYKDTIPIIPEELIQKAYNNYKFFYDKLTSS